MRLALRVNPKVSLNLDQRLPVVIIGGRDGRYLELGIDQVEDLNVSDDCIALFSQMKELIVLSAAVVPCRQWKVMFQHKAGHYLLN